MTYAELTSKISSVELELWMALDMVKAEECPNCGVEPKDLMKYAMLKVKCPVCHHEHGRVRPWTPDLMGKGSGF